MEYLNKVLGIEVTYEDVEFKHLPNFIVTRYRLQMASMNGKKVIFLYPKTELEQIEVLKKHIARIQKNENKPIVLVLNELGFRKKEYLIREKIPFIVEGKQIYLPFMALYLQERCDAERIGGNRSVGKWIFGIGRVFHVERTERQVLCNRKNLSMERCYDK